MKTAFPYSMGWMARGVALVLTVLSLGVAGCGGGGTKIETGDFEQAFAGADAALKGQADEAVKALKAGKILEGATVMANMAKAAEKMNDGQKNALINLGANLQVVMAEDAESQDINVFQAVEDMMAALDGREASKVGVNPDLPPGGKPATE